MTSIDQEINDLEAWAKAHDAVGYVQAKQVLRLIHDHRIATARLVEIETRLESQENLNATFNPLQ